MVREKRETGFLALAPGPTYLYNIPSESGSEFKNVRNVSSQYTSKIGSRRAERKRGCRPGTLCSHAKREDPI